MTEGHAKPTAADPRVPPSTIVYDATLTLSLPVAMNVASGLSALAHCVDSLWGPSTDPVDRHWQARASARSRPECPP
ncbi:iron-containing alcohol dehydrogenase [Streptomyces sp. NPDC048825]|uniref:iron-containing alcohol dehydrogenase n=1 Tax=Streptomyces sp. NPDC048825 TaxID=3365592 RepID=UPI003713D584